MMNTNYGKLEGNSIVYAPDALVTSEATIFYPTAEQYAAHGWLPVRTETPAEKVGVVYTPSGWEQRDGAIWRTFTESPYVAPPTVYSVEDIIYGLIQKNALQAVKQIVGDYWELFTMRDAISTDNEIWAAQWETLKAAIVASGALTEAEVAEILEAAEV